MDVQKRFSEEQIIKFLREADRGGEESVPQAYSFGGDLLLGRHRSNPD
jgi:hypothetical protein